MSRLDAIAAQVKRQAVARMRADPRLTQWPGGSLGASVCVYASRGQDHAVAMHAARRDRILRTLRAEREANPVETHKDCPFCPECTLACGTLDGVAYTSERPWVQCPACGHQWSDGDDHDQARRADAAYAKIRVEEEIAAHDHARLGDELWDRNAEMLAARERRRAEHRPGVQADLFGGGS